MTGYPARRGEFIIYSVAKAELEHTGKSFILNLKNMKVICPEHQGVIYVPGDFLPGNKNLVVECPVCNEQVLISDTCSFDSEKPPVNNQSTKKQF